MQYAGSLFKVGDSLIDKGKLATNSQECMFMYIYIQI